MVVRRLSASKRTVEASERYLDVIAPMHSTLRPPDVMRSRTLTADDVIAVDCLPVTSLERTLCDLGRKDHRQNIVTEALTMMRFSASAVLNSPSAVVSAVLRRRSHLGINARSWVHGGFHIQRMDDGWEMTRVE